MIQITFKYVMIKYFNAEIVNNGETKQDNNVIVLFKAIKNLISAEEDNNVELFKAIENLISAKEDENEELKLYVELTDENITKAETLKKLVEKNGVLGRRRVAGQKLWCF